MPAIIPSRWVGARAGNAGDKNQPSQTTARQLTPRAVSARLPPAAAATLKPERSFAHHEMNQVLEILPLARTSRDITRFLKVAYGIYEDQPCWVAPLLFDLKKVFTKANPLFEHAEMQLWVARRDGADVGRIAAILDHQHNRVRNEAAAFFGFFESANDPAVSRALFEAVFTWARERKLNRVVGPMNPTINDECGLLVKGFDLEPAFMMPYNPAYYEGLVEAEGFRKAKDLLAFYMDLAESPLDRLNRIAEKTRRRQPELTFRPVLRKTINADLAKVSEVYNSAWEQNWGFVPMSNPEIGFMAARLKPLLVEGLVWLVEAGKEPVAFMLAMPDFNEAIKPLRGHLMTPQILHFLPYALGWKGTRSCRVIVMGVKERYRGRGLEAVMLAEGFKTGFRLGFRSAEASWILEDNEPMCRFMGIFGARPYKTYRLYEREL
jgi:GNAT superfamily N-acetyltransferase